MFRLVLCELLFLLVLTKALDELEFDPKVAPIETKNKPRLQLWPRLLAQLLRTLSPETTVVPRVRKTFSSSSSPAPSLEFYGALNPIYQTGQF